MQRGALGFWELQHTDEDSHLNPLLVTFWNENAADAVGSEFVNQTSAHNVHKSQTSEIEDYPRLLAMVENILLPFFYGV